MNNIKKITLISGTVFLAAISIVYAEMPQHMLLQIEPGYNPDHIVYEKIETVSFNGKRVQTGTITDSGGTINKEVKLHKLAPGDTLTVDASFQNTDGSDKISCSRTWTAVSQDNIACSPIEVGYQAANNTCVLVCN